MLSGALKMRPFLGRTMVTSRQQLHRLPLAHKVFVGKAGMGRITLTTDLYASTLRHQGVCNAYSVAIRYDRYGKHISNVVIGCCSLDSQTRVTALPPRPQHRRRPSCTCLVLEQLRVDA